MNIISKELLLYYKQTNNLKANSIDFVKIVYGLNTGKSSENIEIARMNDGKPYIINEPNFHFNLSQTKGAILCGVSNEPVGLDIELIRPCNKKIVRNFYTLEEQSYVLEKTEFEDLRFTEIWTKKEAHAKWLGIGLDLLIGNIHVLNKKNIITFIHEEYLISVCTSQFGQINDLKPVIIEIKAP